MEEVSGRMKHKAMVRPALSRRPVHVFLVCRSASLIAASWWLEVPVGSPTPDRLPRCDSPSPGAAARGGGKAHSPLPKAASLLRKVFFNKTKNIYAAPLRGGTVNPVFPFALLLQRQTWREDYPLFVVPSSGEKALASPRRQESCCWPQPGVHMMDWCWMKQRLGYQNCQNLLKQVGRTPCLAH